MSKSLLDTEFLTYRGLSTACRWGQCFDIMTAHMNRQNMSHSNSLSVLLVRNLLP